MNQYDEETEAAGRALYEALRKEAREAVAWLDEWTQEQALSAARVAA